MGPERERRRRVRFGRTRPGRVALSAALVIYGLLLVTAQIGVLEPPLA